MRFLSSSYPFYLSVRDQIDIYFENILFSVEIERKYQEIMKQCGILSIGNEVSISLLLLIHHVVL